MITRPVRLHSVQSGVLERSVTNLLASLLLGGPFSTVKQKLPTGGLVKNGI